MKYYIIAGEASGDLHASNLIIQIKKFDPCAVFRVWGGDRMKQAGAELVRHYRDTSFMGFAEVLANIRTIIKNLNFCKKDILHFSPDALILVDYPGFNLRIARFAGRHNIRTFYYISPQIWAWKPSRIKIIRKHIERMYVILPFEKDFYARYGMEVDYVGHPLLDAITSENPHIPDETTFRNQNNLDGRPIIALLPGSRRQEITRMLPAMLSIRNDFSEFQFVVAGTESIGDAFYRQYFQKVDTNILTGQTHALLKYSEAALVTSGTATLEAALYGVPQVVCYKGNWLSYHIARQLVKVNYISLVNLILNKPVVQELIQSQVRPANLRRALRTILIPEVRRQIQEDYQNLHNILGPSGASEVTARLITERIKSQRKNG